MNIAYILGYPITQNDGVTKKVKGHVDEWMKIGHVVQVFCTVKNLGNSILKARQYKVKGWSNFRFSLNGELLRDLELFHPDAVYVRYDGWSATYDKILRNYNVVVEVNTLSTSEAWLFVKKERSLKALRHLLVFLLSRYIFFSKVKGIVTVTKELSGHSSIKRLEKPTIIIPNGIDLDEYKVIKNVSQAGSRIGIFFIGIPNAPWHGTDLVEKIAEELKEFDFHIVGMEGKAMDNLVYHGYMQKEEYIEILKKCHCCIGSLAMFRKKMNEACLLKVREYIAYGYPIILGCEDTAFLDMKIPEWVKIIDAKRLSEATIREIKEFCYKNKLRVLCDEERNVVNSAILERRRLEFIGQVCENGRI